MNNDTNTNTVSVNIGGSVIGRVRETAEGWITETPVWNTWAEARNADGDYDYRYERRGRKAFATADEAARDLTLACLRYLTREATAYCPEETGDGYFTFIDGWRTTKATA
jgi:hypothetical protein